MNNNLVFHRFRVAPTAFIALLIAALSAPLAMRAQDATQKTFSSAEDAVEALIAANRGNDISALNQILGPDATGLITSGDETQDANDRANFVSLYDARHRLVAAGAGRMKLTVGKDAWELLIPLVKNNGMWSFDATAGVRDLQARRIGANELSAIDVCKALRQAEEDYAANGHDGNPSGIYAQQFRSSPGKQDGLYWVAADGEPQSPAGPLVADAEDEGYVQGQHQPFHGYFFRILRSQGSNAPGGSQSYVVDGRMTRGFAILAFPAEYGTSGVMTFIVGRRGPVFEKDLGESTSDTAKSIRAYDPGPGWKLASARR